VGGTIATAIFGSILANRLAPNIQDKINAAHLPAQFTSNFKVGFTSAGQIFNQAALAQRRAALPPNLRPVFDQAMLAVKAGLATTLHEMFLIGAAIIAIALVASLFMPSVPLRGKQPDTGPVPVEPEEAEKTAEASVASAR